MNRRDFLTGIVTTPVVMNMPVMAHAIDNVSVSTLYETGVYPYIGRPYYGLLFHKDVFWENVAFEPYPSPVILDFNIANGTVVEMICQKHKNTPVFPNQYAHCCIDLETYTIIADHDTLFENPIFLPVPVKADRNLIYRNRGWL